MYFVLVAEIQKKPHIQMLSCVQRKPVYAFFFFQKREALRLSLIWPDITVSSVTV